ncbi:hypothetical protein [uncultured Ruegeria sp.]|uniref:hypothetical protein n=1 Tax=uncultured Ruegeria sp. TaxID=259304 RepID=UPI002601CB23|nr:hypothetical protein [uncultured Ruegeria sp.]
MLSIFARTFMNATRMLEPDDNHARREDTSQRRWLPDAHWWKEDTRGGKAPRH